MSDPVCLHVPSIEEMDASRLGQFVEFVQERTGKDFGALGADCYQVLHQWSVSEPEAFHDAVWDFCGIKGEKGDVTIERADSILDAVFFPKGKISFTENMLARASTHPDEPAIISRVAGASQDLILSWKDVAEQVSLWAQALEKLGVKEGDRVATYLPHIAQAYIIMMAAAEVGAVFSSVGTEMGAQAAAGRFAQIEPKVLIAVDGYMHMARAGQPGKREERLGVVKALQEAVTSIEASVIIPNLDEAPDLSGFDERTSLAADVMAGLMPQPLAFKRRDFNHPLAILFSSGSTGQPKCFVHGTGGLILKHAIEHQLQSDVRAGDRVFFHSTTSWMMFNWLAAGLAQGASILIYDGNPAYPAVDAQLRFAAEHGCSHFGTAAAIVQDLWMKGGMSAKGLDLSAMRELMYTGSVLSEAGFEYVQEHVKRGLSISGICGGTDFVGCYAAGNPLSGTYSGQLKGGVLGMDIDVWDEDGHSLPEGEVGELVLKTPFASRPLYFWNDEGGAKFRGEYFEHFADVMPAVWRHGDAVKWMDGGQIVIEGRSDTTLNQGGVRIGTQQLYDALGADALDGVVVDYLAASFKDASGGDHTALFVVLADGVDMSDELKAQIKGIISDSVGRLSCPHEIIAAPYVLKTPNGKRAEKPTAQILAGKEVKAPETYGQDDAGVLKAEAFKKIAEGLKAKPVYGFVEAA